MEGQIQLAITSLSAGECRWQPALRNNPVDTELNFLYCAILVNRGVLNLILQAATR